MYLCFIFFLTKHKVASLCLSTSYMVLKYSPLALAYMSDRRNTHNMLINNCVFLNVLERISIQIHEVEMVHALDLDY